MSNCRSCTCRSFIWIVLSERSSRSFTSIVTKTKRFYATLFEVYAKWSPPLERSRMSGFGIAGIYSGTVLAMFLSGWLAESFSWQSIFYVFGCIGCVWAILWLIIVRESPDKDWWIKEDEKNYIEQSLQQQGQKNVERPPWKKLFTSPPVIAICVGSFSYTWGIDAIQFVEPYQINLTISQDFTLFLHNFLPT